MMVGWMQLPLEEVYPVMANSKKFSWCDTTFVKKWTSSIASNAERKTGDSGSYTGWNIVFTGAPSLITTAMLATNNRERSLLTLRPPGVETRCAATDSRCKSKGNSQWDIPVLICCFFGVSSSLEIRKTWKISELSLEEHLLMALE